MESFFVFEKIGSKVDQNMSFLLGGRERPKDAVRGRYCNRATTTIILKVANFGPDFLKNKK